MALLKPNTISLKKNKVPTSNFILKAVELNPNRIGAVEECDDVIDIGAGAGSVAGGDRHGCVRLLASLEGSR